MEEGSAKVIPASVRIETTGNQLKSIVEFVERVISDTVELSIARMTSPAGWHEFGQRPEFTEYTVILAGMLKIKTREETLDLHAGQWVQYSTPSEEGAEYLAVCLPAFLPETDRRDS